MSKTIHGKQIPLDVTTGKVVFFNSCPSWRLLWLWVFLLWDKGYFMPGATLERIKVPGSTSLICKMRPCGTVPANKGGENDTKSHDKTLLAFYLFVKIY